jgi:HSP20 family protein
MRIVKRNSLGWPFDNLSSWFNNNLQTNGVNLKTDIKETETNYEFIIEVPGMTKEDIKIEYENNYLIITATKTSSIEEGDESKYLRRERVFGKYSRSYYLGEIDENQINAKYEDGLLKINIPKAEVEKAKTKKYINID